MPAESASIARRCAGLPDPGMDRTEKHLLGSTLLIPLRAGLAGADPWEEVGTFGEAKRDRLNGFLARPNGSPSRDTFGRVARPPGAAILPLGSPSIFRGESSGGAGPVVLSGVTVFGYFAAVSPAGGRLRVGAGGGGRVTAGPDPERLPQGVLVVTPVTPVTPGWRRR